MTAPGTFPKIHPFWKGSASLSWAGTIVIIITIIIISVNFYAHMRALNFKYWNVFSRFVGCFDCVFEVHSVAVILCFDLCSLAIGWKFTLELQKRTSRKSLVWWNMKYFQFDKFHEFVLEGLETSYCYHFSFWIHLFIYDWFVGFLRHVKAGRNKWR